MDLEKIKKELIDKIEKAESLEELAELQKQVEDLEKKIQEEKEKEKISKEEKENSEDKEDKEETVGNEEEEKPKLDEDKEEEEEKEQRGLLKESLLSSLKEIRSTKELRKVKNVKEKTMEDIKKIQARAWAKVLMQRNDLTEEEKRALNSLTTTATTYTAPTDGVQGVNNGGLLIPETVSTEILRKIELISPFLNDVAKTHIKGLLKLPYQVKKSEAKFVEEGVENELAQIEFKDLELPQYELSTTIRITWKLEAMAVSEFINYITTEIANNIGEVLAKSVLYGTGTGQLKGATVDANKIENAKTAMDGIKDGLNILDKRIIPTAKIYISNKLANEIIFAKDKNGSYSNNPVNGLSLQSIGTNKVEIDPYLKDNQILIGSATNYKLNFNEDVNVVKDVIGRARVNDYTGYAVVGGAPVPNTFVLVEVANAL